MSTTAPTAGVPAAKAQAGGTVVPMLLALSFCHVLNDLMQSLLPAIYPILKQVFHLDFGQVGLITLTFQLTASLLQPLVGMYTDRRPQPYSLAVGMGFSLIGLLVLSQATTYPMLLAGAALVGSGSSVFHPEASRVARLASGGRHGLAQSLFQLGGNVGSAIGPLLAAFVVVPRGQGSISWFSVCALLAMVVLVRVGGWYRRNRAAPAPRARSAADAPPAHPRRTVVLAIAILVALIFSKNIYTSAFSTFYTFYLIDRFGVSLPTAQIYLFVFLSALAVGNLVGGPVGDRFGRRYVIWFSIVGALPFTLMLPGANLFWTITLSVVIGMIMSSAFTAILVFGQELMPGKVGLVSGLFFGLAFGLGGLGAAALGEVADHTSIDFVYRLCSVLPVIGLLTWFLPDVERVGLRRRRA
jgi:MFS transporter, FSR family, fosmidomycin resistance protein